MIKLIADLEEVIRAEAHELREEVANALVVGDHTVLGREVSSFFCSPPVTPGETGHTLEVTSTAEANALRKATGRPAIPPLPR